MNARIASYRIQLSVLELTGIYSCIHNCAEFKETFVSDINSFIVSKFVLFPYFDIKFKLESYSEVLLQCMQDTLKSSHFSTSTKRRYGDLMNSQRSSIKNYS